jgi:hypothetical protein
MLGANSFPIVVGVGHNPDSVPLVRGAHVGSSQHVPARIKPDRGQISKNGSESERSEHWAVFHEREAGSYFANDASEFRPESAAGSGDASAASGARDVLAREAPADDVHVSAPGLAVEGGDVIPDGEGFQQPVPLPRQQHLAAVGIKLDSADGAPPEQDGSQDAATCPCK